MVHRDGFSLVELSLVLVILGLLVGGVLTGQNLIRAAELRSVTTEFQKYQTAVMTFRDRYMALPGDMRNATDFWGAMTNCGAASPSGTGTQTCSGNGDGRINQPSAASQTGEMFAVWRHLANAGLIEGSYSGIAGSLGTSHSIPGTNVPASKLSNAGWTTLWVGERISSDTLWFEGSYGNPVWIGFPGGGTTVNPAFTAEEAWNIDSKMDDGLPESGKIRPRKDFAGTGTTHCSNTTTRKYSLNNTGLLCQLMFLNAF